MSAIGAMIKNANILFGKGNINCLKFFLSHFFSFQTQFFDKKYF